MMRHSDTDKEGGGRRDRWDWRISAPELHGRTRTGRGHRRAGEGYRALTE